MDRTWVEGQPTIYQQHDIVHFPDWKNLIVWDLFCNNLASGFLFVTVLTWLARAEVFSPVTPIALTLALVIVVVDLLMLVIDLGDHIRFPHAMRVMHPTSPLSIGVWGLISFTIMLFFALAVYWVTFVLLATIGLPLDVVAVLCVFFRLFTVLALVASCFVLCYKGVAFSCTSQPGVKRARWLSCWVVLDAVTMGMGLLIVLSLVLGQVEAIEALVIPFAVLIILRCLAYALVWMDLSARASLKYSKGHEALNAVAVFGIAGLCAVALCFFGPIGTALAALICLGAGLWERYWVVFVTHPR